ncbi:MAG: hypothetical protein RBS56_04670 [Candidatus Gracilibacteria bacterium]|jgi:hypothetical protein|nr:hypothetical protein [Candidatus Gracilibacteria bacterium]
MKKILIIFSILLLSSCSTVSIQNQNPLPKTKEKQEVSKEISLPGKSLLSNHLDSDLKLTPGIFVLAPDKKDLEKFYSNEKTPLIFSEHKFVREDKEGIIISNSKEEFLIEDALVIPFPIEESFNPGETVLTAYPEAKGFTYAYILKPEDGKYLVRYMDENLSGRKDILDSSKLKKLGGDYVKGAIIIVKEGERYLNETLLCDCNGFVLTISKNGIINLRNKEHTVPVQFSDEYKSGDDVFLSLNGVYVPGTVLSQNLGNGSYEVMYKENNTNKEKAFDLTRITKNLD